jgi:tryptophan-rich sensory protein
MDQPSLNKPTQILGLVTWALVTFIAAALGNLATSTGVGDWYQGLAKPWWTPPDWVFGPVWTILYVMMAIAAWLVWRRAGFMKDRGVLMLYLVQLALNTLWSILFFVLRRPDLAAAEIMLLWLAIAATMIAFGRRSPVAGLLLLPYLAWVTYAAVLNLQLAQLNA